MSAQLEKVSQEVAEHRNLFALKADQADIGQMRSQLGSLGHGLAQKVDQLDRETSEFMTTAMQKITRIGEQMEQKATSGRLDQLDERLNKVLHSLERKAEDMALRRLEEQVIIFGECVEGKAERNDLQKAQEQLQELTVALDPKAEPWPPFVFQGEVFGTKLTLRLYESAWRTGTEPLTLEARM
ncbi:unnamed protein product [Symbiodinium natans]|uniref:Uncharacterized protein n=1 Tax=Symbiodinium natans TaxID=878477 RepID=A0A812QDK0_9DINO|nr:unnamed protein product [Symbiodinium natans]